MLGDKDAIATVAVRNLETAKKFYEGVLGLKPVAAEGQEVISFRSGSTLVNVYRSAYAGSNRATAINWAVGEDIEGVVRQLRAKGVEFEHYDDVAGMTRKGDVHVASRMKAAWFKDPDGNILSIVSG